eukprot:g2957.t1
MSESSFSSDEDDEETLDLARLKRMIVIARDLQASSKMDEEIAYESMLETISFVFGEAQNFARSFDNGKNVSEAQTSFEMLFNTSKKDGVPKLVRDHLVSTLKKLVLKLKNDGKTRSRIHQKQNDDIQVFVLLPMAYRELEASEHHDSILEPFCAALSSLNSKARFRLVNIWSRAVTKNHFEGVLTMLHNFVTLRLYTWEGGAASLFARISRVLSFMQLLFKANELHEKREGRLIVSAEKFYNEPVNREINFHQDIQMWLDNEMCFCKFPFIMNAANKALALRMSAHHQMSRSVQRSFMALFTGNASDLTPYMILRVRRDQIVRDSLQQLQRMSEMDLRKPLKVKFVGEEGVDEGGVQKEYFQVITRELIDPKYGMFIQNKKTRTLWLNGRTFEAPVRFELIGTLLGVAVHNSVLIDLRFPTVLYKKLMNKVPVLNDLVDINPDTLKGMKQLLEMKEEDVEDCDLTFEITEECFGAIHTVALKRGGEKIAVTAKNRDEYVRLYVKHLMMESVKEQFDAMKKGFMRACDSDALKMFRPEELELLICGRPELDFHDLEKGTRYDDGYTKDDPIIKRFWKVVHEMDLERQRKLLTFVTGSDRAPIDGLSKLRMVITKSGSETDRLPSAHTCFNHLLLPPYKTKSLMKKNLYIAIEQSEGFGLK